MLNFHSHKPRAAFSDPLNSGLVNLPTNDFRKEDLSKALSIFNRFLAPGAPDEVNIESNLISQIRDSLASGHAAANIFDDAKYSIFLLIKRDSYRRFRRWYDAHHL